MGKVRDRMRRWLHVHEMRSFVRSLDEGQGVVATKSIDGKSVCIYVVDSIMKEPTYSNFYADDTTHIAMSSRIKFSAKPSDAPWFHRPERHWEDNDEQA